MSRRARGEGTVLRDGDGWIARIDLPIGPDGKRRRRKRRARTKTEAFKVLKELQAEVAELDNPYGLTRTVEQAVETYLADQPKANRAPKTLVMEVWRGKVVIAGLGRKPIGKLSVTDCDRFLRVAAAGEYGSRTMSAPTVRRIRRFLINALRNEMRLGNLNRNVADLSVMPDIEKRRVVTDDDDGDSSMSIRRTLSYDEYRRLWQTARFPLRVVVDLCGRNGLRPAEARALRWSCVDLEAMTITINRQMSADDELAPPKTKRSLRTIPIDETTADCLTTWRSSQAESRRRVGARWQDQDLVVTTRYGSPINAPNLRRMMEAACEEAGIDRYVPYELRHSAITFQIAAGHQSWEVSDWAGTSARMIDDIYRHRLQAVVRLESVRLDALDLS